MLGWHAAPRTGIILRGVFALNRIFAVDVLVDALDDDLDFATTNLDAAQIAVLDEPAHGAGGDAAELPGGFLEAP